MQKSRNFAAESQSKHMKTRRKLPLLLMMALLPGCQKTGQETASAVYEQALAAYDCDSTHLSEQLLRRSIRLARQEGDLHTMYLAQLQLAQSLSWGNSRAAFDMARKALQTYRLRPDDRRNLIIILDYLGTYASQCAYNEDGPFDEALHYGGQANRMAREARDTTLISQTLTTLANTRWAMKEYPAALHHAREAARLAPPELLFGAQQVLARTLVSCDSLDEAERVYRQMDYGDDVQAAYIVESNLAKLALRRNDTEAAAGAIDEAFSRAEELYFNALGQKDAYYRDALGQTQENERMRYRQRLHGVLALGALLVGLLLAGMAVRELRLRRREQLRLQHEAETERRRHRHEEETQAELLRQRDATIEFLKGFIFQRSEVVQRLSAQSSRHIALTPQEWAEVERTLNILDNDRFVRLRTLYPDMREEDVQLCILTRLRLTNRAIGNVYAISISAVQHRRQKLKKEVFGETDPDTTLEQLLDRI